jgi:TRAP-type C4-dicarboxylate transport system permease small subunit
MDAERTPARKGLHIRVSEWVVVAFFLVLVVATSLQVLFRYVLNFSISWTDELSRYCLVWIVFGGMVVAYVRGPHATVDLLLDRYRGRVRLVAMTVIDLAIALLFVVLLWGGVQLMELTAGQTTSGLNLPKGAVYAALPFGAVLMLVEIALRIHRRFSGREASA